MSTSPKEGSPVAGGKKGESSTGKEQEEKEVPYIDYPDVYNEVATQYFANIPKLDDKDIQSAAEKLSMLAEDINGPNTFSLESAAYGYIEKYQRLVIPHQYKKDFTHDGTSTLSVIQLLVTMYYNFVRLRSGGVNETSAFFVAAYRTRLIELGYLYPNKEGRSVAIDEVDWVRNTKDYEGEAESGNAQYKKISETFTSDDQLVAAFFKYAKDSNFKKFLAYATSGRQAAILKHMTFAAEQYAASTYLVFRQHGHHYKSEFNNKYDILWKATTIDSSPDYPGHELVHRVAIHSFGVKALHEKFFENVGAGKLAETFVDRQDVAPSGTAVVATCYAAFELMKSLPIWADLEATYKDQIEQLGRQAKKLKDAEDAIKYHRNARLFGKQRFTLDVQIAHSLAPVAKGFITSLGNESDLSKQKALDKRAQQNPIIVMTVAAVIDKVMRNTRREGDLSAMQGGRREITHVKADSEDEEEDD